VILHGSVPSHYETLSNCKTSGGSNYSKYLGEDKIRGAKKRRIPTRRTLTLDEPAGSVGDERFYM
jgi:hypothetical protein